MVRALRLAVFAICLLVTVCGCSAPAAPDASQDVQSTVRRYNELLVEGYRTMNMNPMTEVASKLQSEDEYIHMSSLAEGGVRLDPMLIDLEFVRVSVENTSAVAETRETWDYRQYSMATGDLVLEQEGLIYHLAWDLAKEPDGRWLVTDIRAISTTSTMEPTVLGTITPVPPAR